MSPGLHYCHAMLLISHRLGLAGAFLVIVRHRASFLPISSPVQRSAGEQDMKRMAFTQIPRIVTELINALFYRRGQYRHIQRTALLMLLPILVTYSAISATGDQTGECVLAERVISVVHCSAWAACGKSTYRTLYAFCSRLVLFGAKSVWLSLALLAVGWSARRPRSASHYYMMIVGFTAPRIFS